MGRFRGGNTEFFFWITKKHKVQLFQGGTIRKIKCFRTFQLYVFCCWVTSWLEKLGENFTEVPASRSASMRFGGPPFNQCRNLLHIQQPPPFLRIQLLVVRSNWISFWIPSKGWCCESLIYVSTSSNQQKHHVFHVFPQRNGWINSSVRQAKATHDDEVIWTGKKIHGGPPLGRSPESVSG